VKLLFDENLSRKLVAKLDQLYPQSAHVSAVGLLESTISPRRSDLPRRWFGSGVGLIPQRTQSSYCDAKRFGLQLLWPIPNSPFWFSTTLVLVYFTWGEIYSLFPSASADYFGAKNATSNYAVLYTAKGVATAIGALGLGAFLYERTGSWATGFYISAVMALIAAMMAFGLRASQATAKAKASKVPVPA